MQLTKQLQASTLKKKTKIKKKKEGETLEAFENWLYSDKAKEQPIKEVREIVEEVIEEVQKIADNIVEEISEEPEKLGTLVSIANTIVGTTMADADTFYPIVSIRLKSTQLSVVMILRSLQAATNDNTNVYW